MATMGNPLYSIGFTSEEVATGKSTSRTISGLNLPPVSSADETSLGNDIDLFARRLNSQGSNRYKQATFTARRTVV